MYVGVGIGGTFDTCALLAKKALAREIGSAHPRKDVADIEKKALEKINALGIGAQGFGGKTTALGRRLRDHAHAYRGAARGGQYSVPLHALRARRPLSGREVYYEKDLSSFKGYRH